MKIFSVIFACLCASACASLGHKSLTDYDSLTITMQRTGCFSKCKVYSVTVSPDGNVLFQGLARVGSLGERNYSISSDKYHQLLQAVRAARIEKLNDHYVTEKDGCGAIYTDMPSMIIAVSNGSAEKRTEFYNGCTWGSVKDETQRLDRLGQQIDLLLDTDRLTNVSPKK